MSMDIERNRPVYLLTSALEFPPPQIANDDGLLAIGGDLSAERLLLAYRSGIFPWFNEELPILWYSPDPRMVLFGEDLRLNRSLRKALKKRPYEIRLDTAFREVIESCADVPRPGQDGTWITQDMIEAYVHLHEMGFAHSAEAWYEGELVGGVYGVSLGSAFFGESMFARANDASKIAFSALVKQLLRWSIHIIDCQVYTDHLAHFGAKEISRSEFLFLLAETQRQPTRRGRWHLDDDLAHPPFKGILS